jgi:hypothetical protein
MSNKFSDDNNFEDEDENEEGMFYTEDEYNDLLDENIELKKESFLMSLQELNERLVKDAISICSKNWFWSLKNYRYKIKEIKNTFNKLKEMVDSDIDPIDL